MPKTSFAFAHKLRFGVRKGTKSAKMFAKEHAASKRGIKSRWAKAERKRKGY